MRILVTGATGFVGREVVYSLRDKYDVYVLTRKTSDISKIDLNNLNILQYKEYSELIDMFEKHKFDGVIHTASSVIVNHAKNQIYPLVDSNILFGIHLLEASKSTNVKWFLNTGTFWQNYNNEDYNPVNLYAATKEAFENVAKFYTQSSNLIFTTIKLNDTFGPNDTRDKVFNSWLKISESGESLDMSGGDQIIDISYIYDVVSAYIAMINNLRNTDAIRYNNRSFVVTNKERYTLKELSKIFEDVSGEKLAINWGAKEYRDKEVMNPYSTGEPVPNWRQEYNLKEAIKQTIQHVQQ